MAVRVLHLIKTLSLGGAEVNLMNLASAFDPERVETHIGYSFGGEMEGAFLQKNFRLFKYAAGNYRVQSFHTPGVVWRLYRYLIRNKIQIVHTHNFNAHVWGCLAARLVGCKVVEHVHDFRYFDPAEFHRRRGEVSQYRFIRYFKKGSDRIVVLTRQNCDYAAAHGFSKVENIRLIPNGIPIHPPSSDMRADVHREFGFELDAPLIFTAARFSPEKNIDLILRTAPAVLARCPRARFVIAGDGPLLEKFRRDAASGPLSGKMIFPGYRSDTRRLLAVSDVFWLPSFLELHSIAILEAMSFGTAVLTARGTGSNDDFLEDDVNAVLRDPFSDEGWAEALTGLLSDETQRARIARAGQTTCLERFDIRKTARSFEDLYEELAR